MNDARQLTREILGSPRFVISVPAIAASGIKFYNFEDNIPASKKHAPFDFVKVRNKGGTDINIWKNQNSSEKLLVYNDTIETIENEPIAGIAIENTSSTTSTTADAIKIEFMRKEIDSSSAIRKFASLPFIGWILKSNQKV